MLYEITLFYMKTRNTYNSCSTFLKPTKLEIQRFYGLYKLLGGFGKFVDQQNFVKYRSCTWKLVILITLVQHSLNQPNLKFFKPNSTLILWLIYASRRFWQVCRPTKLFEITLLYMKTRNTYNSCSTFLKGTKLDIQCYHGLFKLLEGFGKFGDEANFMKLCFFHWKLVILITLFRHC